MRGICGLWYLDGRPVARPELERMARHLPGGQTAQLWVEGPVGLAQVGPPGAAGPCQSVDTVVVTDARLDNRADLSRSLAPPGTAGRPSDAQLVRHAWERWHEQAPEHLTGDFAVILWDRRHRRLVAVRDRFGVRPLLWHVDRARGVVACASRLRCLEEIVAEVHLDEARIARHLAHNFSDLRATFVRGIARLPPACLASIGADGSVRESTYWRLDPEVTVRLPGEDDYAERFGELFAGAVGDRLAGPTPVASALSGGLDSSSITAVAARMLCEQGRGPLHALTAVFPSLPAADLRRIDERAYADSVAALGGVCHHEVRADLMSPLQDAVRVIEYAEEPFLAPNLYIHRGLYHAAREAGCSTFLDGIDGDTTVSHGLGLLAQLLARGRWPRLWRESGALARNFGSRRSAILRRHALGPLLEDWRQRLGWHDDTLPSRLLLPELARQAGLAGRRDGPHATVVDRSRTEHWRGLTSPLYPHAFELADRLALAEGVDARYPFFDHRLAEFCLAVPAEHKLRHGWTRALIRLAMRGVLPEAVCRRTGKSNLTPNFTRRLVHADARLVDTVVFEDPGPVAPFVDVRRLQAAWRRCQLQPQAHVDLAMDVLGVVVLALWIRSRKK